ncbi:MAG: hypothetical protein H0T88_04875 [Lysobacter sp.]|nr:hypothetical protein [Lysobacter sp.]
MIPLELKLAYTALVAVIVVVYWFKYGPANFLWGSDIALLLAVLALWLTPSTRANRSSAKVRSMRLATRGCRLPGGKCFGFPILYP